jgi:hypothetical protein
MIIDFSLSEPRKAQSILDTSVRTSEADLRAAYHVGITKCVIAAGCVAFFLMWAICDAPVMFFAAVAFSFKLKLLVNCAQDRYSLMLSYRELKKEGLWYV